MFTHQGPARSDRHNRLLAAYLATLAGYVDAAGLTLLGAPTSHMTGHVAQLGRELATNELHAARGVLALIALFFFGAFLASVLVEASLFRRTAVAYGAALAIEALVLAGFEEITAAAVAAHARVPSAAALLLCLAMGMQNSLVTRLSGAVVRTTHLTGVLTDLGIEAARWSRWYQQRLSVRLGFVSMSGVRNPPQRPAPVQVALLTTILAGFTLGAVAGAHMAARVPAQAMILPAMAACAGACYALWTGRRAALAERNGVGARG